MCSVGMLAGLGGTAQAAATAVPLGDATSFGVLAGSTVTNTGPTTITGDVGVSPGTAITGSGSITRSGTTHAGDTVAADAQLALTAAYNAVAAQQPRVDVGLDLGGETLTSGVYNASSSMLLTGPLTLDAAGDPDAVFVFQIGSDLTTASSSSVLLLNGAQACNVYWQVTGSATLGTTTVFRGNILALTSISLDTGASVDGRVLARNGAVTLDTNVITRSACTPPVTPPAPPVTTPPVTTPPVTTPPVTTPPVTTPPGTGTPGTGSTTYGQVDQVPVGSVDTGDGSTTATRHRSLPTPAGPATGPLPRAAASTA